MTDQLQLIVSRGFEEEERSRFKLDREYYSQNKNAFDLALKIVENEEFDVNVGVKSGDNELPILKDLETGDILAEGYLKIFNYFRRNYNHGNV